MLRRLLGLLFGLCLLVSSVAAPAQTRRGRASRRAVVVHQVDLEGFRQLLPRSQKADKRTKPLLVNFWATWCDPCREEFPHMADLYREFERKDFAIAAISDDVDGGKMRAFVREFRPPFPILVGGGRMKAAYHYRGLPYSVLLDREGRIIERIFGFGGAPEFNRLRETIAKEIRAP